MDRYTKEQRAAYTNAWRDRRRQAAYARFGNVCQQCGSTESLQFDHIDPESKYQEIAKLWTASKKIFEEELQKVQLLCYDCHLEKSRTERSLGYDQTWKTKHGQISTYNNHGCRCDLCKQAKRRSRIRVVGRVTNCI